MKKFKIGVLAALTLSLGITCNSLVFASRESFEMPDFNENPVVTGFMENEAKSENDINWNEEMFLSQNGEVLNFLLNDLKNTTSDWLPETAEEFTSLIFGEYSEQFLEYLDSRVIRFSEEEKWDEARVMSQIYEMAGNIIATIRY